MLSILVPEQDYSTSGLAVSEPTEETVREVDCAILLAAGLLTSTPNNEYIQQTYGSLSIDLTFDAQDIYLDEVKYDKAMFEKDSKLSEFDVLEEIPRNLRKRKSKLVMGNKGDKQSDGSKSNLTDAKGNETKTMAKPTKEMKRKRIRKRKSTKLEDEMCPSDDSLDKDVKEEIQFLQKNVTEKTAVVETVATEKLLRKKKSSKLEEELTPSEDSLDEAEKEWKEFKQDAEQGVTEIEEQNIAVQENNANNKGDMNINNKHSASMDALATNLAMEIENQEENDSNDMNQEGKVKSENMNAEIDQNSQTKESKKEMLERISRAKAEMYPDDSPGTLTPVETGIVKRRKRRKDKNLDRGKQDHTQEVVHADKYGGESQEKEKTVTFY